MSHSYLLLYKWCASDSCCLLHGDIPKACQRSSLGLCSWKQEFKSFILYFHESSFHYWKPRKAHALSGNHDWFNRDKDPLNTEIIFNIISCPALIATQKKKIITVTTVYGFMHLCIGVKSSQSLEHNRKNTWMETDPCDVKWVNVCGPDVIHLHHSDKMVIVVLENGKRIKHNFTSEDTSETQRVKWL